GPSTSTAGRAYPVLMNVRLVKIPERDTPHFLTACSQYVEARLPGKGPTTTRFDHDPSLERPLRRIDLPSVPERGEVQLSQKPNGSVRSREDAADRREGVRKPDRLLRSAAVTLPCCLVTTPER